MNANRFLFQLVPSARPTDEIAFGLLPTVTTDSQTQRDKSYSQGGMPLTAALSLIPTPTAMDHSGRGYQFSQRKNGPNVPVLTLPGVVALLPTLDAYEGQRGGPRKYNPKGRSQSERTVTAAVERGAFPGLKLQPAFAAWMMGFPENWTESPFRSGGKKA
jgi:hypothetical protein